MRGDIIEIDANGNVTSVTESTTSTHGSKAAFNFIWRLFAFGGDDGDRKPYNDNGQVYNAETGQWEWTPEAGLHDDPHACNYDPPHDYQGSVPVSDGSW